LMPLEIFLMVNFWYTIPNNLLLMVDELRVLKNCHKIQLFRKVKLLS
jgi:hypothetical protein